MPVALANTVSSPVHPRPRFQSFKFALGWFFFVTGIVEIFLALTLLELGWNGLSTLTLLGGLAWAVASTLGSFWALWRLERRRQGLSPNALS